MELPLSGFEVRQRSRPFRALSTLRSYSVVAEERYSPVSINETLQLSRPAGWSNPTKCRAERPLRRETGRLGVYGVGWLRATG